MIGTPGARHNHPATEHTRNRRLFRHWRDLKSELPNLRARDAAALLGVSEAKLAASYPDTVPLAGDRGSLVESLPDLGPLMAPARNHAVVMEKTGPVEQVEIYRDHGMGQVVGEHIDLRLFPKHWRYGFAVREQRILDNVRSPRTKVALGREFSGNHLGRFPEKNLPRGGRHRNSHL